MTNETLHPVFSLAGVRESVRSYFAPSLLLWRSFKKLTRWARGVPEHFAHRSSLLRIVGSIAPHGTISGFSIGPAEIPGEWPQAQILKQQSDSSIVRIFSWIGSLIDLVLVAPKIVLIRTYGRSRRAKHEQILSMMAMKESRRERQHKRRVLKLAVDIPKADLSRIVAALGRHRDVKQVINATLFHASASGMTDDYLRMLRLIAQLSKVIAELQREEARQGTDLQVETSLRSETAELVSKSESP